MKYERAMWALARELHSMQKDDLIIYWTALSSAQKANLRVKADHTLYGWGFENKNGELVRRSAPTSDAQQASFAAVNQYIDSLVEKHPEEPAYTQRMSNVLRDGFALNRVEALAHDEPLNRYENKPSTDAVHEAMLRAAKKYGGEDGTFNNACFSEALLEMAGVKQQIDGKVMATILLGRQDVEILPGRAHYRVMPVASSDVMEVPIGRDEEKQSATEQAVRSVFHSVFDKLREVDRTVQVHDYAAENERLLKDVEASPRGVVLPLRDARSAPEAVARINADEPPVTLPHTERAPQGDNPFATPAENRRARLAAASPFPVNEDGAERYDAVTAPATAVYGAEDVLARDLYEKQTPADRKHWEDLRGDHQKSYRVQAGMIPLNLPDLSETYKRQWADDVRAGRKHGAAPALKEVEQDIKTKEDRAIVASRFVDGQIGQDDAKAAGVTLSDIEQAVMRKAVSEGRKTNDRDIALNLYLKLGALAYEAVRRMYPDEMRGLGVESLGSAIATRTPLQDTHGRSMTQWKALTNDDQSRVARAAKHGWLHHTIYYVDPLLRAVAGVANTFREIAESEGMGLATFVNNARMRVVVPELTKDEAELLAWYAHESSRAEVPGIVSWNGLVPGVRERKVLAAYNYVVERMADPHITPEFFTALDAFVADAANFGRKLDKLRKARAEFSALPSNWKIAFRQ